MSRVVALVRGGRTLFVIPLDESGALADRGFQPPPWLWRLQPGDRIEIRG